jgi:hypothetical protein
LVYEKAELEVFRKLRKATALIGWWEPKELFLRNSTRYTQGELTSFTGLEELEMLINNNDDLSEAGDEGYKEDVIEWFTKAKEYSANLNIPRTYSICERVMGTHK